MTLYTRKANQYSHYAISPALRAGVGMRTRRLSGYSVSASRHSANGIATCVGPQMDRAWCAANSDHRALLCHDETKWRKLQIARRVCVAWFAVESIVFQWGVASWRVVGGASFLLPMQDGRNTGPKMGPKKAGLWTGKSRSAISQGSHRRAAPNGSSSSGPAAPARRPSAGCPDGAGRQAMRSASSSRTSWFGSNRAPRCAGALPVRSTALRCVGGVPCPLPNRARCRQCGQGEREEIDFFETIGRKIFLHSAASVLHCSASTSQASRSRKRPAAPRDRLISTSPGRRSRLTKYSWSCSTSCGLDVGGLNRWRVVSKSVAQQFDGIIRPTSQSISAVLESIPRERGRSSEIGFVAFFRPILASIVARLIRSSLSLITGIVRKNAAMWPTSAGEASALRRSRRRSQSAMSDVRTAIAEKHISNVSNSVSLTSGRAHQRAKRPAVARSFAGKAA